MGSVSSRHQGQEREMLAWTNRYAQQQVEKLQLLCVKVRYQQEKHERNSHQLLEFLRMLIRQRRELAEMDADTLKKLKDGCYEMRLYMSTKGGELRVMAIFQKDELKILSDYKDLFQYEKLFSNLQESADNTNVKVDLLSHQQKLYWGALKSQILKILRIPESKQEPLLEPVNEVVGAPVQQLPPQIDPPFYSRWFTGAQTKLGGLFKSS